MNKILRIAILINTSRGYEQGLLRGILKYSRLHGPWKLFKTIPAVSGGETQIALTDLKKWKPEGLIYRESASKLKIKQLHVPMVFIPAQTPSTTCPNIISNDSAIGKMAAEHLLNRNFKHFAFYGAGKDYFWSEGRKESFSNTISKAGFNAFSWPPKSTSIKTSKQNHVVEWLKSLSKPLGVMVCNDDRAYDLIEACKTANFKIPEDVAVIGVGNDELICDFSDPPLSSIMLNTEHAGYQAAQLLEKMIIGKKKSCSDVQVEPLYTMKRLSSDIMAVEDKNISKAVRFIHDNAANNIHVGDVVKFVPLSRRALYQKFKDIIGRPIYDEIRRARMDYAARMLAETNLSVLEISWKLGYPDSKNLSRMFKKEKGMTLLQYRKMSTT